MKACGAPWDWKLHSVTVKADKTKVLSSSSYKLFHGSSYSSCAERSAFRKIYPRVKCPGIVFYHSFQLSQSNELNTKKGIMQWTKCNLHFVVFQALAMCTCISILKKKKYIYISTCSYLLLLPRQFLAVPGCSYSMMTVELASQLPKSSLLFA